MKNNKSIITLEKDNHGKPYVDNMCLFRCLGLHLDRDTKTLCKQYSNQPIGAFECVTIDEIHKVETVFEVNIIVYKLGKLSAQLVRRSLRKYVNTLYVNLYETHARTFAILKHIAIATHAASAKNLCGSIRLCWNDMN